MQTMQETRPPCAWNMCKQSVPICRTTRQLSGWTKRTLTCTVGARKEELQLTSELPVALPGSKGPNVHVIGAITNFQVVKWSRLRGAFRSQSAKDWLADMLQHLPQGNNSAYMCINAALYSHLYSLGVDVNQVVLVCDNAPCHNKVQELELDFLGLTVRRLGPHSPMLNPIENVWSKIKSHIKRHMSTSCCLPRNRRGATAVRPKR